MNTKLEQAIRDYTTLNPTGMTDKEMLAVLKDQLAEMKREPENQKRLKAIITAKRQGMVTVVIQGHKDKAWEEVVAIYRSGLEAKMHVDRFNRKHEKAKDIYRYTKKMGVH